MDNLLPEDIEKFVNITKQQLKEEIGDFPEPKTYGGKSLYWTINNTTVHISYLHPEWALVTSNVVSTVRYIIKNDDYTIIPFEIMRILKQIFSEQEFKFNYYIL